MITNCPKTKKCDSLSPIFSASSVMNTTEWGSLRHRRSPNVPLSFVQCTGKRTSYAGAWLAHRSMLLSVDHFPKVDLEWISHAMYAGKNSHGLALKTADYRDFYVSHISALEKQLKGLSSFDHHLAVVSSACEYECVSLAADRSSGRPGATPGGASAALVPFFGGAARESGGNAHSQAKRAHKAQQLAGAVCSALRNFGRAAVGVCNAQDRDAALKVFSAHPSVTQPAVALHLPALGYIASFERRDKAKLDYHLNQCKLREKGASIERVRAILEENPDCRAKLYGTFDYSATRLLNGSLADLGRAPLMVVQFDCALGAWLPYHLVQLAQALLGGTPEAHRGESGFHSGRDRGALAQVDWGAIDYLYYTEFDQIVHMNALAQVTAVLDDATYVAPQRTAFRLTNRSAFWIDKSSRRPSLKERA